MKKRAILPHAHAIAARASPPAPVKNPSKDNCFINHKETKLTFFGMMEIKPFLLNGIDRKKRKNALHVRTQSHPIAPRRRPYRQGRAPPTGAKPPHPAHTTRQTPPKATQARKKALRVRGGSGTIVPILFRRLPPRPASANRFSRVAEGFCQTN